MGFSVSWPRYPLSTLGARDGAAGEAFGGGDNGAQRVAVVRIARQRLGMQHELTARGAGIGGDDRGFDAELVGRRGLALADAFDLGRVEGIKLPAALALLLRADLIGAKKRPFEHRLDVGVASDLATNVADDTAEPRAQDAQFAAVALELFGVGIASGHHGSALDRIAAAARRASWPAG